MDSSIIKVTLLTVDLILYMLSRLTYSISPQFHIFITSHVLNILHIVSPWIFLGKKLKNPFYNFVSWGQVKSTQQAALKKYVKGSWIIKMSSRFVRRSISIHDLFMHHSYVFFYVKEMKRDVYFNNESFSFFWGHVLSAKSKNNH